MLLCLVFGWMLVRLLPLKLNVMETAACSIAAGLLCGTWIVLLAVLAVGFPIGLPVGGLLLVASTALCWRYARLKNVPERFTPGWLAVTLITALLFSYMHWTHDLLTIEQGLSSAGDTWGDIALHLTLASNFAAENRFSWQFPLFHAARLTYPFLLDFTTALLHRLGWSWNASFAVPSVLLDLSIVQLAYWLAVRLSGKPLAGAIAVLLFLCGGSAAGWLYALHDWQLAGYSLRFFAHLPLDYSHLPAANLNFTNTVTSELLPQRGFALGMAIVLSCLLFFRATEDRLARRTVMIASLLIGLLPFAHVQSFEVGMAFLFGMLVLHRNLRLLAATFPGLVMAAIQLFWQIRNTNTGGFIRSYLGWMRGAQESLPHFWWLNFGLLLPLMLLAGWLAYRSNDRFKQGLALVGLCLFAACNLLIFQPNPYDNIKLLLYWYLILCLLLGGWFAKYLWAFPVAVSLCLSGLLSIRFDTAREYPEVTATQIAWAAEVQREVPEGATILTSQQHNNPVSMLSGRPVALGYPGWLWTYGIDSSQTAKDMAEIYAGSPGALSLLKQYGITYVEIGPEERLQYVVNDQFFTRFPVSATSSDGTVYAVAGS